MAEYFSYEESSALLGDTLWKVNKPTKNSNGYWDTTKISVAADRLIVPYDCKSGGKWVVDKNFEKGNTKYSIKQVVSYNYLSGYSSKKKTIDKLKDYTNNHFDTADNISYLEIDSKKNLLRWKHNKGIWTVTIQKSYSRHKSKKTKIDDFYVDAVGQLVESNAIETKQVITNDSTSIPKDKVMSSARYQGTQGSLNIGFQSANEASPFTVGSAYLQSMNDPDLVGGGAGDYYVLDECIFIIEMVFQSTKINTTDDWILGSVSDGSSNGPIGSGRYCFYSTEGYGSNRYKYFTNSLPVGPRNSTKCECTKAHNGSQVDTNPSNTISTNNTNSKLVYATGDSKLAKYEKVGRFELGKAGVYEDGVAPVPYLMMELRGDIKDTKGYSLSIPANNNSFISLTHERNLHDSYNTFSLQLFDKDAMQVEAKLLLGFRYITFWYTDFVSSSKRFEGEVLDYTTVITGKGLMLTLTGYTSDTDIYTGKDSIPWSKFFEVEDYSFFYWLNDAGEYQSEVRVAYWPDGAEAPESIANSDLNNWTDYATNTNYKFNSSDGNVLPGLVLKYNNEKLYKWLKNSKNYNTKSTGHNTNRCDYWVKYTDNDNKIQFKVYDDFYGAKTPEKELNLHRPYPVEWSLEQYNSNLLNNMAVFGNQEDVFKEKRPSTVVKLICAINGWLTKPEYIVPTKTVSEIPDQISMSYIHYIKEKLITISMSDDEYQSTQYSFWFDDEGYAHYAPIRDVKPSKSLYFNAPNIKDSYPLIGFTAATNGNILMQVNKAQTIEAINVLTGDEVDVSAYTYEVNGKEISPSIYKTEEWYATNRFTLEQNQNNLLSKKDIVSFSNVSAVPSEGDLKKALVNRYGLISRYTYKANLDVYGCADLEAGQMISVYIYLDDGARSSDAVSTELTRTDYVERIKNPEDDLVNVDGVWMNAKPVSEVETESVPVTKVTGYKGNITLHHSSGTYFINKITDTVSGGRYVSSLQVLKIDSSTLNNIIGNKQDEEVYSSWRIDPNDAKANAANYNAGGGGYSLGGGGNGAMGGTGTFGGSR